MARKQKETLQSEGRDNNTRIVKRNWWKIGIISFVVVAILVGISVGLYFLFRPQYSLNSSNFVMNAKISKIKDDLIDHQGNDIALYFYSESDTTVNWLSWDDEDGQPSKKSNEVDGPLTEVVNKSDRTWYAINLDKHDNNTDLINDLFVNQTGEDADFYEGLGFGGTANNTMNFMPSWAYSEPAKDPSTDFEDLATQKTFTVNSSYSSGDWSYTVTDESGNQPTINSSTIMFFDSTTGEMENYVSGFTVPSKDDDTISYDDARQNLITWLTFFDKEFEVEPAH